MSITNKYRVEYGGRAWNVNSHLVDQQKISDEQLEKIKNEQIEVEKLKQTLSQEEDQTKAVIICLQIQQKEYLLQSLWGFERNKNFHKWYRLPNCSCPKMDNDDWWSTDRRIISTTCWLHGEKAKAIAQELGFMHY